MARVTVEDCTDKVDTLYELVVLAAQRANEIAAGAALSAHGVGVAGGLQEVPGLQVPEGQTAGERLDAAGGVGGRVVGGARSPDHRVRCIATRVAGHVAVGSLEVRAEADAGIPTALFEDAVP